MLTVQKIYNGVSVSIFALTVLLTVMQKELLFAQESNGAEDVNADHAIGAEFEIGNNYVWHGLLWNRTTD